MVRPLLAALSVNELKTVIVCMYVSLLLLLLFQIKPELVQAIADFSEVKENYLNYSSGDVITVLDKR